MSYEDIPLASDFSTLKVGEIYNVHCVELLAYSAWWPSSWIPVFPVLASDEPVFSVNTLGKRAAEQRHYHADVRFIKRGAWPTIVPLDRVKDDGRVTLMPMTCLYRHVERHHSKNAAARTRWEITSYLCEHGKTTATRMGQKVFCPHKGARIDICPTTDWNGAKTFQCPLHGAMFSRETLELVSK